MNDADRHLIVGLIDGSLSPEDTEAARARLDTDAEFATAHAEQLAVRSVLTAEAVPSMTSIERQGLRTGLMAHLNLETTPTPATTTKRRKRWLTPVMGLAAATAVVAGFAIIPSMLSSSDGDSAAAPAIVSRDLPEDSSAPSI
ncbi:MAG: hypothetical protein KDB69_03865, partial [Acidimicrobiia bacterium]|nr:hypothetical protein [Acidimicrobiia bacterium]